MELLSVNVGMPRPLADRGEIVQSGIFKDPVSGPVHLGTLNLDGDGQADLRVHGGVHRAVYAYPHEHYSWWQRELGRPELAYGSFGENFTTRGLLEDEVFIGDVLKIGTARVQVSQPRSPCFKLGIRLSDPSVPARLNAVQRSGFYLRVLDEGVVAAGDAVTIEHRDAVRLTVREAYRLRHGGLNDRELLARAANCEALTPGWRQAFRDLLGS